MLVKKVVVVSIGICRTAKTKSHGISSWNIFYQIRLVQQTRSLLHRIGLVPFLFAEFHDVCTSSNSDRCKALSFCVLLVSSIRHSCRCLCVTHFAAAQCVSACCGFVFYCDFRYSQTRLRSSVGSIDWSSALRTLQ